MKVIDALFLEEEGARNVRRDVRRLAWIDQKLMRFNKVS